MLVSFQILSDISLVHVKYRGFADFASTLAAAQACTEDPAFTPELPHFFDLGDVTGFEQDFAGFFAMQAQLAAVYPPKETDHLGVFYAPVGPAREMAELARKSWDGVPHMVLRILDDNDQAIAVLGLSRDDRAAHLTKI